jgi:hypothetical protein
VSNGYVAYMLTAASAPTKIASKNSTPKPTMMMPSTNPAIARPRPPRLGSRLVWPIAIAPKITARIEVMPVKKPMIPRTKEATARPLVCLGADETVLDGVG